MIETDVYRENGYKIEAQDEVLARNAAELLHAHYPNHLWAVFVTSVGGAMIIKNLRISGLYGYVLHLRNVYADPTLRCVIKAGGEILERAGMKRGANTWERPTFVEGVAPRHQPSRWVVGSQQTQPLIRTV